MLNIRPATAADAATVRFDAFHTHKVELDASNLMEALLASASIPLVLEGVADIPRAPPGIYWDGGIIDYHLHLPYHHASGLVLYPHFTDCIVPGWLDKAMPILSMAGITLIIIVITAAGRDSLLAVGRAEALGHVRRALALRAGGPGHRRIPAVRHGQRPQDVRP